MPLLREDVTRALRIPHSTLICCTCQSCLKRKHSGLSPESAVRVGLQPRCDLKFCDADPQTQAAQNAFTQELGRGVRGEPPSPHSGAHPSHCPAPRPLRGTQHTQSHGAPHAGLGPAPTCAFAAARLGGSIPSPAEGGTERKEPDGRDCGVKGGGKVEKPSTLKGSWGAWRRTCVNFRTAHCSKP